MKSDLFSKAVLTAEPYKPPDLPDISLIKLIANPAPYDQKVVRVKGYLVLEFEGTALYLHREDAEQMLSHNALWLAVDTEIWQQKDLLSDRYVLVTGTFQAESRGHMNLFSGCISGIEEIKATASRKQIQDFLRQQRYPQ